MELEEELKINGYVTDPNSLSPPTPPSPLPISFGAGNQKYVFSPSPTPSPPFSPLPPSSHDASAEYLPLLRANPPAQVTSSTFSVDRKSDSDELMKDKKSSCLKDLLQWLAQKCCNCCF